MDIFNEWEQEAFEVLNERNVEFEDTEWDQSFQLPDRHHVNVLLDISEDITSKEQEPFEFLCLSGWEEAIQGWGRTTPLGCLIQTQRKEKRMKTGDIDHHHCLLCIDLVKLSEPHESEFSLTKFPESSCDSSLEPLEKDASMILGDFLNSSSSHTSTTSSSKKPSPTESFQDLQKATQTLMLQGKTVEENDELCETSNLLLGLASSQGHHLHHSASQCPIRDRRGDMTMILNSFAILPPVKTCQLRHQSLPSKLQRGAVSRGLNASSVDTTPARENTGGVERGEEMRDTDTVPYKETVPDETNQGPFTYKYWPTKQSHHLLPAFSGRIPKRCDMSISTLADPVPCVTYPLGRHLRQDTQTSSGHRLYFGLKTKNLKYSEPQLPILFGTRVPVPASVQRLL